MAMCVDQKLRGTGKAELRSILDSFSYFLAAKDKTRFPFVKWSMG
jgi:hypothetical protein